MSGIHRSLLDGFPSQKSSNEESLSMPLSQIIPNLTEYTDTLKEHVK